MLIRLAQKEDYNQLIGLLRQLNLADPAITEVEFQVFTEIIGSKFFDLIVAEQKSFLVGSCYLNIIPNLTAGGRSYAVVENVISHSANRNQGIGKALINHALDLAWKANCYKVMLMSGRKDEGVHEFYEKCGFDPDEKQAYIYRAPKSGALVTQSIKGIEGRF